MGAIAWRHRMSVGQPVIDDDHKHLIKLLNELDEALMARVFVPARAAKVLMRLLEYTQEHFAREERIMQVAHYPDIEDHIRQHRDGVRAIAELSDAFGQEPSRRSAEKIYKFTAEWLVNHIILQDTQLTPFVKGVWA